MDEIAAVLTSMTPDWDILRLIATLVIPIITYFFGGYKERQRQQYQEDRWYKQHILEQKTIAFHELAVYLTQLYDFLRMIPNRMTEERYIEWENRAFNRRLDYLKALAHCSIYLDSIHKNELLRPIYIFEEALDCVELGAFAPHFALNCKDTTAERRAAFDLSYQKAAAILEAHSNQDKELIQEILKKTK